MDYVLALVVSVMFPYVFKASGIDYNAYVGVKGSMIDYNSYNVKIIDNDPTTPYEISGKDLVNQDYGFRPDFFVDYGVQLNRWWIAPTIGVEPLTTGIQVRTQLANSGSGNSSGSSASEFDYIKGPYMGLKLGYTVLKSSQDGGYLSGIGLTPYVMGAVEGISYEDSSTFASAQEHRYSFFWGAGAKIDFKGSWAAFAQYRQLRFNSRGSASDHQLGIVESEVQFGVAYKFLSNAEKAQLDKTKNYNDIIDKLTPDFKGTSSVNNAEAPSDLMPTVSPLMIFPPSILPVNNSSSVSTKAAQKDAANKISDTNLQLKEDANKANKANPIKKANSPSDDNFNF